MLFRSVLFYMLPSQSAGVVCCVIVIFAGTQPGVSASALHVEHIGPSSAGILIPPAVLPASPGRLLQSHAQLSVAQLPPLHVHGVRTSRRGCSHAYSLSVSFIIGCPFLQWWLYELREPLDPCVNRLTVVTA